MKPWTAWLAHLGLAGSCLLWAGCGGGESTDAAPESEASAETVPGGSSDAAADAAAPEEGAGAPVAAAPIAAPPGGGGEGAGASPAAAPADSAEKSVAKPDGGGSTAEMLALASGPAPAPEGEKPAEPGAAGGGESSGYPTPEGPGSMPAGYPAPGGAGGSMPAGYPAPGGGASTPSGYPAPGGGAPAGYPAPGGGAPAGYPAPPGGGGAGAGAGYEGAAGYPGGGGEMGGGGDANAPANFSNPQAAVQSFINALQAKDPQRLREATALRAATESEGPYRKVLSAILEESLAAEDLDELAKKFEGMQVTGMNPAKSSARVDIIVGRTAEQGGYATRKITVRKEKAGWKVVDIAGQREFDASPNSQGRRR